MFIAKTLSFYKREDIQEAIVEHAKDKEVAVMYGDRGFGKRPQTLSYKNDVLEVAKNKATSLHCSEELWNNPSQLSADMRREELDDLRKGWDFLLDIDCTIFEYSKIAAYYVVKALQYCDVNKDSITVKFSGNKGFHIGIPWEAFPKKVQGEKTKKLFPEAPKRLAEYVKFLIRQPVKEEIKKREGKDIDKISDKVNIPIDELKKETTTGGVDLNPAPFIEIDTLLISSRHLYRMPYSFHEKSQLVSVPIQKNEILDFEKEMAEPENVEVNALFMNRDVKEGNAKGLFVRAYDYQPEIETEEDKKDDRTFELPEHAIEEECFPPCIKKILAGLDDGRKRAVFILINFLKTCGWGHEEIKQKLYDWNEKNKEPLREVYIKGQLRYSKNKDPVPPPNCEKKEYYKDIGVKCPDKYCRYKNPANYAKKCHEKEN